MHFDPVFCGFALAEMTSMGWAGVVAIATPIVTGLGALAGYAIKVTVPNAVTRFLASIDGLRQTFQAEMKAEREAHAVRMDSLQRTFSDSLAKQEESAAKREAASREFLLSVMEGRNDNHNKPA